MAGTGQRVMSTPISATTTLAVKSLSSRIVVSRRARCRIDPQRFSHGRIQFGQCALQGIDHLQVQPQHRAMVLGGASAQLGALVARGAPGQRGQMPLIAVARDDGVEHRAPALPQHIRQDTAQLGLGNLQYLLNAQRVLGDLPHEMLARCG